MGIISIIIVIISAIKLVIKMVIIIALKWYVNVAISKKSQNAPPIIVASPRGRQVVSVSVPSSEVLNSTWPGAGAPYPNRECL